MQKLDLKVPSLSFFEDAFRSFSAAAPAPVERFYSLAGYTIRLLFPGAESISLLTPALEHLEVAASPFFDLTICVWDSASTHVAMVPPPWTQDEYLSRGAIRGFDDGACRVAFHVGSSVLSVLNLEKKTGLFWTRDFSHLPFWEKGAPFLTILHWWLAEKKVQLVHAAAVGTEKGGVLLVGKGGSGKSTTALSSLLSGCLYVSDDYSAISLNRPYTVHSLYNTGKCDAMSLERLPALIPLVKEFPADPKEKSLLFLHRHFPHSVVSSLPIRAIVIPKLGSGDPGSFSRVPAAEALMALAPSTLFQLADAGGEAFRSLAKVVKELPCFP